MPPEPPPAAPARPGHPRWLWPFLLLLGSTTLVVAWSSLALASGHQHGWLALLAALEAAWMLRLGGMRPGGPRALRALAASRRSPLPRSVRGCMSRPCAASKRRPD